MTAAEAPRVLHSLPGRARVHLPQWSGSTARVLERNLCELEGVNSVRASARTANVLVHFDRGSIDEAAVLSELERLARTARAEDDAAAEAPARPGGSSSSADPSTGRFGARRRVTSSGTDDGGGGDQASQDRANRRARIAVRGLDRNPDLARAVVERLEPRPEVTRVSASPLTGRVLVELAYGSLEEIAAELGELEVDDDGDVPRHPLDRGPTIQGSARLVGATLGLGVLAVRRVLGAQGPPTTASGPAEVAATIGVLEALPFVVDRIEAGLGHDGKDLLFGVVGIASMTLSGSAVGLALGAAASLRLLTEARARRSAWSEYEERMTGEPEVHPGATVRLRAGDRTPLPGRVVDGFGTAIRTDGMVAALAPGQRVEAGARVYGGPVSVTLENPGAFAPAPDGTSSACTLLERYTQGVGPVALAYAVLTGILTRSPGRAFTALLLVSPRPAMVGADAADQGASARVLRAGVTQVGSRGRPVRRPDTLVIDSPRLLTNGLELTHVETQDDSLEPLDAARIAAGVAAAAGSPWGPAFPAAGRIEADDGTFDGATASGRIESERWTLGPPAPGEPGDPPADRAEHRLELRRRDRIDPVARLALRPRIRREATDLVETCRRHGVEVEVLNRASSAAAAAVAERAGAPLIEVADATARVHTLKERGQVVAVLSDSVHAGEAFEACDLAIALSSGRRGRFLARADLLAPALDAVAATIEAGVRRDASLRDSIALSLVANVAGAVWGLRSVPTFERAALPAQVASIAAIGAGWARLRGGSRARSVAERLSDPVPERWGRQRSDAVLAAFESSRHGLSTEEAHARWRPPPEASERSPLVAAVVEQLTSPLTAALGTAAALSFGLGATGDVVVIAAAVGLNAAVGAWQERQAGRAARALDEMSASSARVLRDGRQTTVPASGVVPGDVLVLASGDRLAADARLLDADRLEVDEAALTGESLPVSKAPTGGSESSRVVLEGSDVTVGTGRAVVVAVGEETRMGATAAALSLDEERESPLDARLNEILRIGLPVIAAGGAIVAVSGLLWGRALVPQLTLAASIAIGAIPEGLPLLAGVAEAGVARRLARRRAVLRRLSAVEALGRVDVACADKTGTMTAGRLELTVVADPQGCAECPSELSNDLREVLLAAALASPPLDSAELRSHPTDVVVVEAARRAGLEERLTGARDAELPFDPTRSFHATLVNGRLYLKGAVEVLAARCSRIRHDRGEHPLEDAGREALLARAQAYAEDGLRVLMVAEASADVAPDDPTDLVALGFVGISDPLRPTVPEAVRRCEEAGVRVLMLTGDHPATARAIAREAGLESEDGAVLTGPELADFEGEELERRLERARVVARISPLDKLKIVEALQRRGHVVAMTGDGVNDAPALRLADVGVAMGAAGTEVARQAADLILTDDDFSTLVESLVEGRGFWQNIRRALGLLLGGNLGEIALMVGASVAGLAAPLSARQVLAVNLVTDALPAVAIAVQRPEHRNLAELQREGAEALDAPLRAEVLRRSFATAAPSLAAFVLASRAGGDPAAARAVAFASVVVSQLGQTLDLGWAEGRLTRSVAAAVFGSLAVMAATLTFPPLRGFLGLAAPGPGGLLLIAGATATSVALGRVLPRGDRGDEAAEPVSAQAALTAATAAGRTRA